MMLEKNDIDRNRLLYSIDTEITPTDEEIAEYDAMLKRGEKLPENVAYNVNTDPAFNPGYIKIKRSELTDAQIDQFLHFEQLHYLRSIKKWVLFTGIVMLIFLIAFILFVVLPLLSRMSYIK